MSVTFICVLVDGHVDFSPVYVEKLYALAKRFYKWPARFVCLTDQPDRMPEGVEPVRISLPSGCKGWWAKVQLFNPNMPLTGRVVYLDLDTLPVSNLASIVQYPARFALAPDGAPNFQGDGKLKVVKRFNSSVMVWNAGENAEIFKDWTTKVSKCYWGDQDWIGTVCPNAEAMPLEWFPRLSEISAPPFPKKAKVVLCKKPKNVQAAKELPWFREAWT